MNCEYVRKNIDESMFEIPLTFTPKIEEHLSSCASCREYIDKVTAGANVIQSLKQHTPELNHPDELVSDIMTAIAQDPHEKDTGRKRISWLPRLLAAACVAILITFALEQFVVLDKLNNLENHLSGNMVQKAEISLQVAGYTDFMLSDKILTDTISEGPNLIGRWKTSWENMKVSIKKNRRSGVQTVLPELTNNKQLK